MCPLQINNFGGITSERTSVLEAVVSTKSPATQRRVTTTANLFRASVRKLVPDPDGRLLLIHSA
jgi:hypothetical protein